MTPQTIQTYLPSAHQKIAAALLAVIAIFWMMRLMKRGILREEHALLWLVALVALSLAVFVDPVLVGISALLGTAVPASALLLLGLFFLFVICVWLTCIVSVQQKQLASLAIELSVQKFVVNEILEATGSRNRAREL